MTTDNNGVTVRYTKDGKSHQIFIEEILLLDPKNVMYEPNKQQFITAAKELLIAQQGPGGEFEIIESLSSKPPLPMDWGKNFKFEGGNYIDDGKIEHYIHDGPPGAYRSKCPWNTTIDGKDLFQVIEECQKHAEECDIK